MAFGKAPARAQLAAAIVPKREFYLLIRCRCRDNEIFTGETESWGESENQSATADYRSGSGRAGGVIKAAGKPMTSSPPAAISFYQPAPRLPLASTLPCRAGDVDSAL